MWSFVLAALATWRVTHLLANEDGPADLIVKFRALLGHSLPGKLMDCFYCLSIWIAAPAALFVTRKPLEWVMTWLALSGSACLLDRITGGPTAADAKPPFGQGGMEDVLRIETHAVEEQPGAGSGSAAAAERGDAGQD